ncbi:ISL3 family transposase [Nitrospira sp. Kam-Ns4a]
MTTALAGLVAELGQGMTVKAVAVFQAWPRDPVKAFDTAALRRAQQTRSLEGIPVLGMDEISVGKGHRYWTLINALEGPRGPARLPVVEGRSEKSLQRCWRWFGTDRAATITHAGIDLGRAFETRIRAHGCPQITGAVRGGQIIDDTFPVRRHLTEALNTVRKAELRKALGRFTQTLAGKKVVLLTRRARVRGKARKALDAVLAASPKLLKAHLLKESFGHLWDSPDKGGARRFWEPWKAQLTWQRMPAYRKFVTLVERHWEGILAFCDKQGSLGSSEASHVTARNVIRRAYGYRDNEDMKLKIIQACTPWMAEFRPWRVSFNNSA